MAARPLQLVFGQFLRDIHPVGTHTHRNQRVVIPFPQKAEQRRMST